MGLLDAVLGGALGGQSQPRASGGDGAAMLMQIVAALLASRQDSGAGAAGGLGGLAGLAEQFQRGGLGDVMNSWIGTGENQPISPGDLASALGADQIDSIARQSGMSRDDLLQGLSQYLPDVVDQLTPDGRLPDENEASKWI